MMSRMGLCLAVGFGLFASSVDAQTMPLRLENMPEGAVLLRQGKSLARAAGVSLKAGDNITAGATVETLLTQAGRCTLLLTPGSGLKVLEMNANGAIRLRLEKGTLFGHVRDGSSGGDVTVELLNHRVQLRPGSAMQIQHQQDGDRIANAYGAIEVTLIKSSGRGTVIGANQYLRVNGPDQLPSASEDADNALQQALSKAMALPIPSGAGRAAWPPVTPRGRRIAVKKEKKEAAPSSALVYDPLWEGSRGKSVRYTWKKLDIPEPLQKGSFACELDNQGIATITITLPQDDTTSLPPQKFRWTGQGAWTPLPVEADNKDLLARNRAGEKLLRTTLPSGVTQLVVQSANGSVKPLCEIPANVTIANALMNTRHTIALQAAIAGEPIVLFRAAEGSWDRFAPSTPYQVALGAISETDIVYGTCNSPQDKESAANTDDLPASVLPSASPEWYWTPQAGWKAIDRSAELQIAAAYLHDIDDRGHIVGGVSLHFSIQFSGLKACEYDINTGRWNYEGEHFLWGNFVSINRHGDAVGYQDFHMHGRYMRTTILRRRGEPMLTLKQMLRTPTPVPLHSGLAINERGQVIASSVVEVNQKRSVKNADGTTQEQDSNIEIVPALYLLTPERP